MDDFLGQTSTSIDLFYLKELGTLLRLCKKDKNKKVILNSRMIIYKSVRNSYYEFSKMLDNVKVEEYIIDLDNISKLDKARVFYNLLDYYNLIEKHIDQIREKRLYLK